MANRNFDVRRFSIEQNVVDLFMDVAIGASGAPTLTTGRNAGVTSVTRSSAGLYVVVLPDSYNRLMNFQVLQVGASQDLTFQVTTDYVAATNNFSFTCKTANTATDPTNGTSLKITVSMKNSSVL